jgi:hypothetical protein
MHQMIDECDICEKKGVVFVEYIDDAGTAHLICKKCLKNKEMAASKQTDVKPTKKTSIRRFVWREV